MTTATLRRAALLLLALAAPAALAQNAALGDDFIYFVSGTNVRVPNVAAGQIVDDALEPGNRVVRFTQGNWVEGGFEFNRAQGIDASANVGATYGESDTLFFRLRSDPANATVAAISILIADATDDSTAPRASVEADPSLADHQMRLVWTIPAELHDGVWHDLAVPLPPATYDALESARAAGELEGTLAANWRYSGAWSLGAYGVGEVGGSATPADDPLWVEFGWNQLYRIGPFWDNPAGLDGGPIFMDDVYIGGSDVDLDGASGLPTAMSGVTFAADGDVNTVSWNQIDGAGGYNVYASLRPITDVTAEGVTLLDRVGLGEDTEVVHRYEKQHPTLPTPDLYYAVTSLSEFGVENTDVSSSSDNIRNATIADRPYIRQLNDDQATALFDAVSSGAVTDAGFPAEQPVFALNSDHRTLLVGTAPTDTDVSATFKVGYSDQNEWFVYGEVTDDTVVFAGEETAGGLTYLFDTVELEIGHYDVRSTDAYGDILVGSPHLTMQRGDEPDYQIRIGGRQNTAGAVTGSSTFIAYYATAAPDREILETGKTNVEKTATGWRFLTLLSMNQIGAAGDAVLAAPKATEINFIPFSISINDRDDPAAEAVRDAQIVYSVKPNVTDQWYQSPIQWETVAIAGTNVVATAAEDGVQRDGFSLAQSTPNPAFGQAKIAFTLGAARRATVEVFNVLGQRVMTAVEGEFAAGPHEISLSTSGLAAGVYVYRLSAGDYVATRRMTVVR